MVVLIVGASKRTDASECFIQNVNRVCTLHYCTNVISLALAVSGLIMGKRGSIFTAYNLFGSRDVTDSTMKLFFFVGGSKFDNTKNSMELLWLSTRFYDVLIMPIMALELAG